MTSNHSTHNRVLSPSSLSSSLASSISNVAQPDGWDMSSAVAERASLLSDAGEAGTPSPVTVTIKNMVKAEKVKEHEEWQAGILSAHEKMEGFLGMTMLNETSDDRGGSTGALLYIVIIKYSSVSTATAWNESPVRLEWLEKLRKITGEANTGQAQIAFEAHPKFANIGGLGVLGGGQGQKGESWWNNFLEKRRVWFLIWIQVYILVELFSFLLPFLFSTRWTELHPSASKFLATMCTTIAMDVVTVPIVFRAARRAGFIVGADR